MFFPSRRRFSGGRSRPGHKGARSRTRPGRQDYMVHRGDADYDRRGHYVRESHKPYTKTHAHLCVRKPGKGLVRKKGRKMSKRQKEALRPWNRTVAQVRRSKPHLSFKAALKEAKTVYRRSRRAARGGSTFFF